MQTRLELHSGGQRLQIHRTSLKHVNGVPKLSTGLSRLSCKRRKCDVRRSAKSSRPEPEYGTGGLDPRLEAAVPADQRPVNELGQLREGQLYSWAALDVGSYARRLGVVWLGIFLLISGPIAYQTFDPAQQPVEWAVAGCFGSLLAVILLVVRIYLGWSYVGSRLLSAAVPYEETGWYDGQTFVKPPEVLARDRLLGSYEVKPKLARLKRTLIGTASGLVLCVALLTGLSRFGAQADAIITRAPRQVANEGLAFSKNVVRLTDLRNDDDLAAEEALAQGGMPGYCSDRYFRAAAGGQYCSKFDSARSK